MKRIQVQFGASEMYLSAENNTVLNGSNQKHTNIQVKDWTDLRVHKYFFG